MKNCIVLFLAVAGTLAAQSSPSVIGNGWVLDHVIVDLSNPEVMKSVFRAKLGFTLLFGGKFPAEGLEQASNALPFSDPTVSSTPICITHVTVIGVGEWQKGSRPHGHHFRQSREHPSVETYQSSSG